MKKPEDVRYAETNVKKFVDRNVITSGLVRRFMQRCVAHVAARTGPGDSILDCGVSEGTMTKFLTDGLADRTVLAFEFEPDGCEVFHASYPELPIARASIYQIPLPDSSVDIATAFEVLEHLEDPGAGLAEMRRVSRGAVVVTVPYEPFFRMGNVARGKHLQRLGNTPGHINHWGVKSLEKLMLSRFPSVQVTRFFPWLLATSPGGK